METIFDHNPTKDELRYLADPANESTYRAEVTRDEALTGLCMLFAMRGDEARAKYYADQISDRDFVDFELYNGDLIAPSAASKRSRGLDTASKTA